MENELLRKNQTNDEVTNSNSKKREFMRVLQKFKCAKHSNDRISERHDYMTDEIAGNIPNTPCYLRARVL